MTRPPKRVEEMLSTLANMEGVGQMIARQSEFPSLLTAKLAGVAVDPQARRYWEDTLDEHWANAKLPRESPEVIVGAGLHAAIYAAMRVRQGYPRPLVIEEGARAGGTFAITREPTFFLNSRNRPGELGVPGRDEALNCLPGAPIQPADLSSSEYQTNADLAFAIRATLACNARVVTGTRANVQNSTQTGVKIAGAEALVETKRLIVATGIGDPVKPAMLDGKSVVDYMGFLRRLTEPFPFKDCKRVAVVGAGDAGRTVVEALIGQGPQLPCTVASLDYIERIDWFGVEESARTREGWETCNRSRYRGIGRALPRNDDPSTGRVKPQPGRAEKVAVGHGGAFLDGVRYDLIIWAGGFTPHDYPGQPVTVGGRTVAKEWGNGEFIIGPAASLTIREEPDFVRDFTENSVALFRYADRTAMLATELPDVAPARVKSGGIFSRGSTA